MNRAAGVLLHPTSLPGRFGIGDFGSEAESFLEWLAEAGQTYWQVLPMGPVDASSSPYRSFSAFAGNPLLISPDRLVSEGLLTADAADAAVVETPRQRIDFASVRRFKNALLRSAWEAARAGHHLSIARRFEDFTNDPEVSSWLEDWVLFAALKHRFDERPWFHWPSELRQREESALARARAELAEEISFNRFIQFLFFDQWDRLQRRAREKGVHLFGDLAIYVAPDSADVWANQELFDLDPTGEPRAVAGVPPDYFSATGQRWGNPLYRWDQLASSGFDWWIDRLRWNLRLTDLVRLDHFRGFAAYWEVPATEETAVNGEWRPGPGLQFFEVARKSLGELPLVAEDLGVITEDVTALRRAAGLPGMRVLQFAFSDASSDHRPHRVPTDTVLYTGTHDNATVRGWFDSASAEERRLALDYVGGTPDEISWSFIRAAYTSVAEIAIAPCQDLLDLGNEARLNTPGEAKSQWTWRLEDLPSQEIATRLRRLTAACDRLPKRPISS